MLECEVKGWKSKILKHDSTASEKLHPIHEETEEATTKTNSQYEYV